MLLLEPPEIFGDALDYQAQKGRGMFMLKVLGEMELQNLECVINPDYILERRVASESGKTRITSQINTTISSQEITDSAWDIFVCAHEGAHYTQSSGWAKIKSTIGWEQKRIVICKKDQILAGVQLLSHSTPFFGKIQYSIKGPLITNGNVRLDEKLIELICNEGLQNGSRIMVIQPPDNSSNLVDLLQNKGFQTSRLVPEHSATLTINLETSLDQIMAGMKRQTRQNVRRGQRKGIQILEGKYEELKIFYQLHESTSKRQGFVPYPWKYIHTMWQVFQPQNHLAVLLAQCYGEIISALLLICFGKTVFAYLLGWSGLYKEIRPNDTLFWGAIQWAQTHNYKVFNFGGINPDGAREALLGKSLPENIRNSPDFLKYGFGGKVVFSPPAYDYLPNPIFNLIYRQLMINIGGYNPRSKLFRVLRRILLRD